MKEFAVGVVGLGLGRHFVAANATLDSVSRLVICDPDTDRLASVQAQFASVAATYTDLDDMLAAENLDAVNLVTPDHLHRPQALACLAAGCHVLQTKPLATTLDDGRAILEAVGRSGKKFMVAQERRYRSLWRAIRERIAAGDLGDIIHVRSDQVGDKRTQFSRSPWYASAEAGRTAIVGTGIHDVDLIRYLVGKPIVSVAAYSNRLGTLDFPASKTTVALLEFDGGTIGEAMVSYETRWPASGRLGNAFRLIGTEGIVVDNRISRVGRDTWEELPDDPQPIVVGIRGCVESFLRAIIEDTDVPIAGEDAFASLAAAVAADESAATGLKTVPATPDA